MVGAGHVHVGDVQQQPAARALQGLAQERGLAHRRGLELEVGRRVLQQHAALQPLLHPIDVVAHAVQRRAVVGHRQQVVEEGAAVAGPRQVLGKRGRLVAIDQRGQPVEVRLVERLDTADRQTDAMQRQRIVFAHPRQEVVERTAVDHVVLGVHFEEADVRARGQHLAKVLGLEPDAGASRQARRHAGRVVTAVRRAASAALFCAGHVETTPVGWRC